MTNSATTSKTTYTVCVREWFDRQNGNTYHTIRLIGKSENGNVIDTVIPLCYGSGDLTYLSSAAHWLGISSDEFVAMDWSQRRALFTLDVVTVKAMKDLHYAGKREP